MSNFFKNFPLITYNGKVARNIVDKAVFVNGILTSVTDFYPYNVREGERADTLAFKYYGDSSYDWLVCYSASIYDPYYQWPMTNEQFDDYIVKKYGSYENSVDTVDHYEYDTSVDPTDPEQIYKINYTMKPTTWNFLDTLTKSYWKPVTAWQTEFDLNESRRVINLVSKKYKTQIDAALAQIFK